MSYLQLKSRVLNPIIMLFVVVNTPKRECQLFDQ